jgi:hypothetical protein
MRSKFPLLQGGDEILARLHALYLAADAAFDQNVVFELGV